MTQPQGEQPAPDHPYTLELPEPSDPWAGRAPIPQPLVHTVVVPEIVYVERRRRRRWPWVLSILIVSTVLCCAGCGALLAPITAQWPAHVSVGAQAGGFTKDTSVVASLVADQVALRMKAELPVEGAFAAKLDDPRDPSRWILFLGATRLILDPAGELDSMVASSRSSMRLTDVTAYDPGPLNGEVRCAKGYDDKGTPIDVCAWIDHGSEAVGLFYGRWSLDAAAEAIRAIRADVLTRH